MRRARDAPLAMESTVKAGGAIRHRTALNELAEIALRRKFAQVILDILHEARIIEDLRCPASTEAIAPLSRHVRGVEREVGECVEHRGMPRKSLLETFDHVAV